MKKNPGPIVGEAAEAAGVSLDRLNAGVEALADGSAGQQNDRMQEVGQKVGQMTVKSLGDGLHLGEAAAHDRAFPLREEVVLLASRMRGVGLGPELDDLFLVGPGSGGLQIDLQKIGEAGLLGLGQLAVQPEVTGVFEGVVAYSLKLLMLSPAGLIDRVVEQFGHMKLVVDDSRLRRLRARRRHIRRAHVHRRRLDLCPLCRRQRLPQRLARGLIMSRHYFQHACPFNVGRERHIPLAAAEALLVEPDVTHSVGRAAQQPSLDRAIDDALHAIPVQLQQVGRLRQGPAGFDDPNGKCLEMQRKARVLFRPRCADRLHPVFRAAAARYPSLNHSQRLHHVQVPPLSLRRSAGQQNAARIPCRAPGKPPLPTRPNPLQSPLARRANPSAPHAPPTASRSQEASRNAPPPPRRAIVFSPTKLAGLCRGIATKKPEEPFKLAAQCG